MTNQVRTDVTTGQSQAVAQSGYESQLGEAVGRDVGGRSGGNGAWLFRRESGPSRHGFTCVLQRETQRAHGLLTDATVLSLARSP